MFTKEVSGKTAVLIGIIGTTVGYLMSTSQNMNISAIGSIVNALGIVALVFWIANSLVGLFKKGISKTGSINNPASPIRRVFRILKKVFLFLAVVIVSAVVLGSDEPFSPIALAILVVYIWSKVSSRYLEKKDVPNMDNLKDTEALESLFSDEIEEEEAEFAERLTSNDTKSNSKDSVL
ncbi:MAG: hypothetical protein AAB547_01155 [Patescibacteria group bacterium]